MFHAGTTRNHDGVLLTSGGRVIGVTGSGESIKGARDSAYAGIDAISFEGMRFRRDIPERAIED